MFGKSIRYFFVTACIMASASALAQTVSVTSPACSPPVELTEKYFPRDYPNRQAVIVFVHGVLGDAVSTWTKSNLLSANKFWPCFLDSEHFKGANVYLHGFTSNTLVSSPSIDDAAKQLFNDLKNRDVFSRYAHVAFVAHSMGGLIVTRSLQLNQGSKEALRKVRFVQFYGTPGKGASIAEIVSSFSGNIQFKDLVPGITLETYARDWIDLSKKFSITSFCAAEQSGSWLGGFGPLTVPQESATALCSGRVRPIFLDHINMVKPSNPNEQAHNLLTTAYYACIRSKILPPPATEAASEAGRQAIEWTRQTLELFNNDLKAAGEDLSTELFGRLATSVKGVRVRFTAPDSGETSLDPALYREIWNDNDFRQVFRDQLLARAKLLILDTVFRLKDLPNHIKTSHATDFLDKFVIRSGQLDREDLVISLRFNGDDSESRVLLFLNPESSLETNASARLKGFALQPKITDCS